MPLDALSEWMKALQENMLAPADMLMLLVDKEDLVLLPTLARVVFNHEPLGCQRIDAGMVDNRGQRHGQWNKGLHLLGNETENMRHL